MPSTPTAQLETFANPAADRDYPIRMRVPEFPCLCPGTGQPDFATLDLEYVPDRLCVELKSLKLYIWSFRERGAYHEAVINEIADHLQATLQTRFLRLSARFNVRGGIYTTVVAVRRQSGWGRHAPLPAPEPARPEGTTTPRP